MHPEYLICTPNVSCLGRKLYADDVEDERTRYLSVRLSQFQEISPFQLFRTLRRRHVLLYRIMPIKAYKCSGSDSRKCKVQPSSQLKITRFSGFPSILRNEQSFMGYGLKWHYSRGVTWATEGHTYRRPTAVKKKSSWWVLHHRDLAKFYVYYTA